MITPTAPIKITESHEIVSTEEIVKTYPALWVTRLNVMADDPSQPIRVMAEFAPWNPEDNSIPADRQGRKMLHIRDLDEVAAQNPKTVGAAMKQLFAALELLGKKKELF